MGQVIKKRIQWLAAGLLVAAGGLAFAPIGDEARSIPGQPRAVPPDLSQYADAKPVQPLHLLFLHHSVGGQLLADPGVLQSEGDSIHKSHPNGGGLRRRLAEAGYEVHEASYGSEVGEMTDLFDWLPKFKGKMAKILRTRHNDQLIPGDQRNQVVLFKSCYPNSRFVGRGEGPGNPLGTDLTVANAKATLNALLPEFAQYPGVLFVYLTAPPVAPRGYSEPGWKWLAKRMMGRPVAAERIAQQARLAREFNNWVVSRDGWLKGYQHRNVVVFDYFDVLTEHGKSDLSRFPGAKGDDSHPTATGQAKAAELLVPFLNRAVRRAGLSM